MTKPSLKKNFLYNILYQFLILVIPLITSPYLTRTLGVTGLGTYTVSQAFANYFTLFILLGLNNYGNREIAKYRDDRTKLRRTFWEIYTFQMAMLILVELLYLFVVTFCIHEDKTIYYLQAIYVFSAGLDINWYCFGTERFKLTVTRNAVIKIVSTAFVFLCVNKETDLWIYTLIITTSTLLSQAILWPFVIKEISYIKPNVKDVIRRIKPNLTLFFPVIAVSIYTVMDKIMIGMIDSKEEVAYYTYALKIIDIPQMVIIALSTVMLPRVSNMIAMGKDEETHALLNSTMQYMLLFTIGAACIISSISYDLIPWYYGDEFRRCALFVRWLSPFIVLGGWNGTIRTQFIIPNGLDYIYMITVSSGAVVNLILNAMLIPHYRGLGAVWATIASQATVCFMQFILTKKYIHFKPFFSSIFSFTLCAIAVISVLNLLPSFGGLLIDCLVKTFIGVILYSLMSGSYLIFVKKDRVLMDKFRAIARHKEKRKHA